MTKNNSFSLDEEVRCDHIVTTKVKRLWQVELDLADQLKMICEKNHIRYFAGGGTLLGAVRHKGFIPWDDDMDYLMLWSDFQKFCEVAANELEYPYFLEVNYGWARIRNLSTTAWTRYEVKYALPPFNLGVFIDIFPLTVIPSRIEVQKKHEREIKILRMALAGERKIQRAKYDNNIKLSYWLNSQGIMYYLQRNASVGSLTERYLKLCSKFENDGKEGTMNVGLTTFRPYENKLIWDSAIFQEEPLWVEFENTTVPIPPRYDEELRQQFGNYNEYVKGAARHMLPFYDTEKPFTEYIDKIRDASKI